jgi:hypothetical protein
MGELGSYGAGVTYVQIDEGLAPITQQSDYTPGTPPRRDGGRVGTGPRGSCSLIAVADRTALPRREWIIRPLM